MSGGRDSAAPSVRDRDRQRDADRARRGPVVSRPRSHRRARLLPPTADSGVARALSHRPPKTDIYLGMAYRSVIPAAVLSGCFTLAVSVASVISFAYHSPALHIAVETAAALISLFAAQLIFARF